MTRQRGENPSHSKRYQRTVSIPVRIVEGRLEYFYGGDMPKLRPGTIADLVVQAEALIDPADDVWLSHRHRLPLLAPETKLMIRISSEAVPARLKTHVQRVELPNRGPSACVPVILIEPLEFCWRGNKRGALMECGVGIPALPDQEAASLNHAYRLVSEAFEPHRRSHAGNVFSEVYYNVKDAWLPLDEIRGQKEAELEPRLKRGTTENA